MRTNPETGPTRSDGGMFLQALTNERARTVQVGTGFLGRGEWQARVHADGAASTPNATPIVLSQRTIRAGDTLRRDPAPSGGQAIRLDRR